MKNLKKIIIIAIFMVASFTAGFFANEKLGGRLEELASSISTRDKEAAMPEDDTYIKVETFKDIPSELPENWKSVEITTAIPAVALGTDFENYDNFAPGGHNPEDGRDLGFFRDDRYEFFITNPTINTPIAQECAKNGYGVLAVSIYDKKYYDLKTKVIFYDQRKDVRLRIYSRSAEKNQPVVYYSGGAFAALDDLVVFGDEEDEPALWNVSNETLSGEYKFNPYCIQVYNLYLREDNSLFRDNIGDAINLIDGHSEYLIDLDNQIDDYVNVKDYFVNTPTEESEASNPTYEEFALKKYVEDLGGTVQTDVERSYLTAVSNETGSKDTLDILDTATETMNIALNDLNIGIAYDYYFGAMDDVVYFITINGKILTYDEVNENHPTTFRADDLTYNVKVGQEATISRAEFNYLLDLIENSNT